MAYTTIDKPTDYFNTKLYTGTGSSHAVSGIGFQPDWVWIKCRDDTHNHQVFDSVRGVHKRMRTDTTGAETESSESLKSFDSDGFTLGTQANVNASASGDNSFVSWNWLAGGSASSNTDGSITSTVSANTTAGFSVVTWTGNGSNGATIGHSLNSVPKMMIFKIRSTTDDWTVYHTTLGAGKKLNLNDTGAESTVAEIFNNTEPTSSLITFGTHSRTNTNGANYVGYIFAEKKGFSKFGKFTGNGNADGTFVYTGFKPAWILVKNTEIAEGAWVINDNKRNAFNPNSNTLTPHNSETENTGTDRTDFLSNGFKLRVGSSTAWNGSGNRIIYMAFAESPFVTSSGVPTTAR